MKVHNDLKELLEAYNKHIMPYTSTEEYRLKERIDSFIAYNSLALGKPEPLAKNKQFEKVCTCHIPTFTFQQTDWCIKCAKPIVYDEQT